MASCKLAQRGLRHNMYCKGNCFRQDGDGKGERLSQKASGFAVYPMSNEQHRRINLVQ